MQNPNIWKGLYPESNLCPDFLQKYRIHITPDTYWVPQKSPQICTVIVCICIEKLGYPDSWCFQNRIFGIWPERVLLFYVFFSPRKIRRKKFERKLREISKFAGLNRLNKIIKLFLYWKSWYSLKNNNIWSFIISLSKDFLSFLMISRQKCTIRPAIRLDLKPNIN